MRSDKAREGLGEKCGLEIDRPYQVADEFNAEMEARLREQTIKDYRGWDDPNHYREICQMILEHASVSSGQEVDAASLAMILWFLRKQGAGSP